VSNDPEQAESQVRSPQSDIRDPLSALRRFARPRAAAVERCELCSAGLAEEHTHLIEPATRQIVCACDACALLFSGRAETKYRRIPRRVRRLADFQLSDAQWDGLMLPIGMAFFFHSSAAGKVTALYPSPAGATESLLALDAWEDLVRANPVLEGLEPDTEALLVNRVRGAREYYVAPIDECFKLVGLIRVHWRGLSGGAEVWRGIEEFFAGLKEKEKVKR
jgi:hypothetical protein